MAEKQKFYPDVQSSPNFPEMEKGVLARWQKEETFTKSVEQRSKDDEYVFYDGPPFANGLPHYGHLLTSCVKDIDARYRTMKGKRVERRFGWDCHGLPAEMESEKELKVSGRKAIEDFGIDKFNSHCRESVMKYTNVWQDYINRAGRWVDFENDYKTMDQNYMESVLWAFKELWDKEYVYESHRVMPYSWAAQTPLSNFETRMDDSYRDREDKAITVAFKLKEKPKSAPEAKEYYMVAWTTTPWTLPSNLALAVSPELQYNFWVAEDGVCTIVADFCTGHYEKELEEFENKGSAKGSELVGAEYEPLFPYFEDADNAFKILAGDFIEEGSGTGVVHLAPGFGEDDQRVCADADIPVVCPVDEAGCFTNEIFDIEGDVPLSLKGLNVLEATEKCDDEPYNEKQLEKNGLANLRIINWLKLNNKLVKVEEYKHSYPHCWRTDKPLIYKAVPSWYVEVTKFKDRMVKLNQDINWIPEHIRDGQFGKWLENARDWSISRNRYWGTPIPVWRTESGKTKAFGSIKELEDFFGVEVKDLHRPFIDTLTKEEDGETWTRVTDVFDCWFESGSMPFAQVHYPFDNKDWFESHFPADFIVEYVGQTRGWFYTLVVLSTALFDCIPFKNCICHGIILDAEGKKLSKRLRNYPDPNEMFDTYGADAMRWRMVKEPVMHGGNLLISKDGSDIRDVVRLSIKPIWNAYNFFTLYANADGIKAEFDTSSENLMDKYILAKVKQAVKQIDESLDNYLMPEACVAVDDFFEVLNNWYIRRNKDRFWIAADKKELVGKLSHLRPELKGNEEKDELILASVGFRRFVGTFLEEMDTSVLKKTDEELADDIVASKQSAYNTLYTVLHIMCRAMAPLLPFTTEEVFVGLSGEKSVHLEDFPKTEDIEDASSILSDMDRARDICNAILAIRSKENIRVRQPLSKATVYGNLGGENAFNFMRHIAADETNVKTISYSSGFERVADHELKINFPILGKRLPEKMKQIIPASKKGEWKQTDDGKIEILGEVLEPEEASLALVPKDPKGAQALSTNDAMVVLDLEISDELAKEGLARDLVRLIQEARKQANLHISDRIELALEADNGIKEAAEQNADYIKEQTLANILEFNLSKDYNHKIEQQVEGKKVTIGFTKAA